MNYINRVCAFTGYRTQKLNYSLSMSGRDIDEIRIALSNEILRMVERDFTNFMCGMAIGSDMIFAEEVLEMKKYYPKTFLIAVIPCHGQEKLWTECEKKKYHELLERADKVLYTSEMGYTAGCMQKRNRYLVDNCDELLSIFDGQNGGTKNTIEYAKRKRLKITVIDPSLFVRIELLGDELVSENGIK